MKLTIEDRRTRQDTESKAGPATRLPQPPGKNVDAATVRQETAGHIDARGLGTGDAPHTLQRGPSGARLVASEPRIEVPSEDNESDDDDSADRRQRWLRASLAHEP